MCDNALISNTELNRNPFVAAAACGGGVVVILDIVLGAHGMIGDVADDDPEDISPREHRGRCGGDLEVPGSASPRERGLDIECADCWL